MSLLHDLMNDDFRPDPDVLLAQLRREEGQEKRGRLFLFLGMCPGVGKTYAMLLSALQRQAEGLEVLAGVVETHGRRETEALLDGLQILPRKKLHHGGHVLEEFDLDAALTRRPDLLLVDELAHTNAPGSRHLKRYQDVIELLDAGIDVCTTLNVQHIESQVDTVRQITGVAVRETVPDSILDRAQEIQLVDLSVEKLKERLAEGKVYLGERAEAAREGFFRETNLTALRELALRFTAEHVDRDLEDLRREKRVSSAWKTHARLMVGVGPSPYSESLVRWTRRAAGRLGCPWLAVWVESTQPLSASDQEMLGRGLTLARNLGGEVVHAMGDDVAAALLSTARDRNVSQIVVGKPDHRRWWKPSLADRIIAGSGDIDVCVVRPLIGRRPVKSVEKRGALRGSKIWREYGEALGVTFALTCGSWLLLPWTGYMLPALVFLCGIVAMALRVSREPVLLMATLCALLWDFLFIPPRFTLHVAKPEDVVMLAMFFIVAWSMGHLTAQLRRREKAERRRQVETDALLRVTQSAALAAEMDKGLSKALRTIDGVMGGETALIVRKLDRSLPSDAHPASSFMPDAQEWGVAGWAYTNRQMAGRFTDTLPSSVATWFPLQTATSTMGVVGLHLPGETPLDFAGRQAMEAFALQLALVLEKDHFIQAVNQAELIEKSEQLRRTLLDSVSHELKTPLAVIRAALDGWSDPGGEPYRREIVTATKRLQRVVDGLLQMARLESEVVEPRKEWSDVSELVSAALESTGDVMEGREVRVGISPELPLIRTDAALLGQALANILHNAGVYSPGNTPVEVSASFAAGKLRLSVRDHGPGLPPGEEGRVFGKFHRTPGSPAGGTGLGLSIARGFVRALGGDIAAWNHAEGGAVFEIVLPAESLLPEA
jgi:two-component system sensor histidine kinase KdpD